MFLSIFRKRAIYRPLYICTSCLALTIPHPDPPGAHQVSSRSSFSTNSIYHDANTRNAASIPKATKRTRLRPARRRGRPAELLSHSRDNLAALKESLAAEEAASTKSKTAQKSKANSDFGTTNLDDRTTETIGSAAAGEASAGTEETAIGATAIIGNPKKNIGAKKIKPTTILKKSSKSTKKPIPKPPEVSMQDDEIHARHRSEEFHGNLPGRSKKSKIKRLTDAQREKVDAVLLGAKNKRSATLTKKINGHMRAIGENETVEALVKFIEEGKLTKSDDPKSSQKTLERTLSKLRSKKNLTISKVKQPVVQKQVVQSSPHIRAVFPETPPPMVTLSLKEALEAHAKNPRSPRRLSLIRAAPRGLTRASTRSPSPSTTQGLTRTTGRPRRGTSVMTGPLVGKAGFEIKTLAAADLELTPINKEQPPVPNLSYGLDRVLFNPGVYHLQDPRSRVFNFDPYLQSIMPVEEFDFTALKRYITSSRDETLLAAAKEEGKKYTGSTSSMTAALAHFHFLLSQWRPINTALLSQKFPVEYHTYTSLQRSPSAVFLKWKDGVYAIDADKQFDTANILSTLGKSMEKLLTLPTEDFEKYRKENADQIPKEEREAAEPYNYTTMGDFLMRSQLDAHDSRLPGTGMFDLKTRAVVSIRMDVSKYEQGRDYEIRQRYGEYESFEREYYDMIRAAFLKYSLQVRMGRMDGIFVAFHNTQRIFGFQYISQPEMDLALHGTEDTTIGDAEFKLSVELLNKILDKVSAKYPKKSIRLHFETRDTNVPFMYIFAEPMEDEQIQEIQESNKAVIEEFENRVLGLSSQELEEMDEPEEKVSEHRKAAEWASMRAQVEKTMVKDELDLEEARSLAETMIEESDIFGSEAIPLEEKERLINDLLESSAFSEVEDAEARASGEDEEQGEDAIEGASAASEDDGVEGDEDNIEEGDEGFEEDEEHDADGTEENKEEQEGKEEDVVEEDDNVDEWGSLERAEDSDVQDVETPTDIPNKQAVVNATKRPESVEPGDKQEVLVDAAFTDSFTEEVPGNATKEPDIEMSETLVRPPGSVEPIDKTAKIIATETYPTDATSHVSDIVEHEAYVPGKKGLESDSQDSDGSELASEGTDPVSDDAGAFIAKDFGIPEGKDVLAMTLTIRNKVNGEYVARPEKLRSRDKWTIEYALEDVSPRRAGLLYQACKTRRAKTLNKARKDDSAAWNTRFMQNLWDLSKKGKKWREKQNKLDGESPRKVLDFGNMKAEQEAWTRRDGNERMGGNYDG